MKKVIFKYPIGSAHNGDNFQKIEVPRGSQLLSTKSQNGIIQVWYLVDPTVEETETHAWFQIGTGHSYDFSGLTFVDTIVNEDAGLVWHMFYSKL